MVLAAYDLSQPGSSTLSALFCVMTSLPHCNRNAGSCTDGYTTECTVSIRYFTNPLKTGDIYLHAQTVCTRPLLGGEGPGDEAGLYVYLATV